MPKKACDFDNRALGWGYAIFQKVYETDSHIHHVFHLNLL